MNTLQPTIVILAGCNGAGKTTASRTILAEKLQLMAFVNADFIAKGLAGFNPDSAAVAASRIMIARLDELAAVRESFAFETTLSARTLVHRISGWHAAGYRVLLYYFSVASPDVAVSRVASRVKQGGHDIPEETIRRRYERSLANLFSTYMPLADAWWVYNNSDPGEPKLVAEGSSDQVDIIDIAFWNTLKPKDRP